MIEEVIYSVLSNDAGVAAITTSINPDLVDQTQTPEFIEYTLDDNVPNDTKDGASDRDEEYFTITSWGKTRKEANQLAFQVRDALDGYSGTIAGVDGDIVVKWIYLENEENIFDPDGLVGKEQEYRAAINR